MPVLWKPQHRSPYNKHGSAKNTARSHFMTCQDIEQVGNSLFLVSKLITVDLCYQFDNNNMLHNTLRSTYY